MQVAFCLEMLYDDLPFLERIDAAHGDGIENIEIWDWRDKDIPELAKRLKDLGMRVANMSGNRRFSMIEPRETEDFLAEVDETAEAAAQLACPRLMLLAQNLLPDGSGKPLVTPRSQTQLIDTAIESCAEAARLLEERNIDLVIEPLNDVLDHPGFLMNCSEMAFTVVREISDPRLRVLYDVYHMAMMGENILATLEQHLDLVGHIHFADMPGRREPGSGELDLDEILSLLRTLRYDGVLGFEFEPTSESEQAVRQAQSFFG